MIVRAVVYAPPFLKRFKALPREIAELAVKKEVIFRDNPLHPSLRLHALRGRLKGLWSISITAGYRIIFERHKNGDVFFISVGKHDIYKCL